MSTHLHDNKGKLARFILRRDRVRILMWIASIALICLMVALAFSDLYPTQQDRMAMAETMKNPVMTAMVGPGYGLSNYTLGAMMAHEMLLFTAVAVAIMSIFLVVRHTRKDEERGRLEVIRSLPVGRLTNLSSTMIVAFGVNILLALVTGLGLFALGYETMDFQGSMLFGAALGATGIFFSGVTALFSQLSESSRGAVGYSFAFLGLAYLLRAVGDVSNEVLSWFSPLGWALRTEVYVNNHWGPVLLTVGAAICIMGIAFYLNSVRDLEAGFIPAKPGRKTASAFLQSPLGLAVRLLRTSIIIWAFSMFIIGASYGSVLGDLETFFETNEIFKQMLSVAGKSSMTEQFITVLMSVISMICTIPVLQMIFKLRGEEKRNHTEHLLTRAVSRNRLIGSFLLVSVVVSVIMQLLSVVGMWSVSLSVMDDPISFDRVLSAAMIYLPAIWVMIGIAVFLIGFIPKATGVTWLYLGYSFFVVYLGGLMQFPKWMAKLSPFGNVPKVPVEDINMVSVSVLTVIALGLMVLGFIGYRNKNIQG
ncbi:MAG: putative exporter of polyketide antibiotic [Oscillospiraceae bacterium]|jgi:ABC-2 type transport system permease protein|nr:putative exporter of polyketide antibiotic [Oscillospiraceae bacterium]